MKKTILAMVAAAAVAVPATAADETLIFRGNVAFITPTADSTIDDIKFEADSAVGLDASFEYKFAKAWGVEAAVLYAKHDVKADGSKFAEIDQTPLLISANYHFPTAGNADWYVGPTVGYTFWGDVDVDNPAAVDPSTDGEFTYGVNAGVDVPIKGSWAFTGGLRYLFSKANGDGVGDVDVNPLVLRAGVAYRF
ncbi:MAG TPA: OmpW family outer membrane protein [Candidatus Polarisedimenticolaceae bacterium]